MLDNLGFSLALALISLFSLFLSILTALMFPGITGILIFYQGALKLRLLKYDYLEKNPGVDKRLIPWEILLEEEKKLVGKRSLKGLIFPWKE